ncbi:hypothetical protein GCK72_009220 [Caenorhabditis remanei]|uniref:C2H2-type domain-containing protein n=1 Tax=Caenorhabditis remanei TaxID=31234 RepID=A0A6A5H134_CAERE|nr:hypothetical protein GCK72_009220 [Caenorhabditis remanei]KAF1760967.1 hypothetical protein GCK72_009220 [Caenorhabditis remanei]
MKAPEKKIKCDVCHKTFDIMFRLKEHSVVHSGARPFECKICGKSYKFKTYLKYHMTLHTENASLECSVCKTSMRKNNLRSHMKVVHDLVGDQLDTAIEKSMNKETDEKDKTPSTSNVENVKEKSDEESRLKLFDSVEPLAKDLNIKDATEDILKTRSLVDLNNSQSFSTHAIKQEPIDDEYPFEAIQEKTFADQSQSAMQFLHREVFPSKSVMESHESRRGSLLQEVFENNQGFQVGHFQNSIGAYPTAPVPPVHQQFPSNFEEDCRQISHQISRVASNSTKERQDCFRQLLFATVFAFEGAQTCTNVEDFFRMMGERYAKK